jgi:HEAT repeat protein
MYVRVYGIAGQELANLAVDAEILVRVLKLKIKIVTDVPAMCQHLMLKSVILQDNDRLKNAIKIHAMEGLYDICLTLVITYEPVVAFLSSPDADDRHQALESLADLAETGTEISDVAALSKILPCLRDHVPSVRVSAAYAVGKVWHNFDDIEEVVHALCTCLSDEEPDVGEAVLETLFMLPLQGHRRVFAALLLVDLTQQDHEALVDDLKMLCEGTSDAYHRRRAIEALGRLTLPEDISAVDAFVTCMYRTQAEHREETIQSLARMAPQDRKQVITSLLSCFEDWHLDVEEAAEALRIVAAQEDPTMIEICNVREKDFSEVTTKGASVSKTECNWCVDESRF